MYSKDSLLLYPGTVVLICFVDYCTIYECCGTWYWVPFTGTALRYIVQVGQVHYPDCQFIYAGTRNGTGTGASFKTEYQYYWNPIYQETSQIVLIRLKYCYINKAA